MSITSDSESLNLKLSFQAYHMHTHIVKALQNCCKMIHNAVKTYNTAAAQLNPPHPSISWENVLHINFLEEFNLLHDTHQDIWDKQWSQPAVYELMKCCQQVRQAYEEIDWCHIAVHHLYMAICDENNLFRATLSQLQARCQRCISPVLLLIRRLSEGVWEDRRRNCGEEGFVDRLVVRGDNHKEVKNEFL